jgi:hypothetical protein
VDRVSESRTDNYLDPGFNLYERFGGRYLLSLDFDFIKNWSTIPKWAYSEFIVGLNFWVDFN